MEDEMVVWHHQLDGHEFEQALGVGNGQGSLVCCSPWLQGALNVPGAKTHGLYQTRTAAHSGAHGHGSKRAAT